MVIDRETHYQFLEDELKAQTDLFSQCLDTKATYLRDEKGELFAAQYLKFEDGEMVLKFSNRHSIPRNGEYLYCFTVPKELRNPSNWGNMTYGDLVKQKGVFSEVVCIWQSPIKNDPSFCLVGFRGVETDFAEHIMGGEGMIVLLGPNKPPFEYLIHLQNMVQYKRNRCIDDLLDGTFGDEIIKPYLLDKNSEISSFLLQQLSLTDSIILQGPPGTGKTYQIAKICKKICEIGGSVLVTALTNRALIEVAEKEELKSLLETGRIHKTKMSVDEAKELPQLLNIKKIAVKPGHIILSTFYITSGEAENMVEEPPFDYIIIDEASQALFGMCVAVKLLGKKCIYVGDHNQLSPIVSINGDKVTRRNYNIYIDGYVSLCKMGSIPSFQITHTYRLPHRAAEYTSLFYDKNLISTAPKSISLDYKELPGDINKLFHPKGGPTLIKTDLALGDKKPLAAQAIATILVSELLIQKEKLHISVLSFYVETTKALQRAIYQTVGYHNNLLIETVSRIQGLTTDVVIYVIPNTGYSWSLDRRLFNVATSRAKRHTIIISDSKIGEFLKLVDTDVSKYILSLLESFSFYIPTNKEPIEKSLLY